MTDRFAALASNELSTCLVTGILAVLRVGVLHTVLLYN